MGSGQRHIVVYRRWRSSGDLYWYGQLGASNAGSAGQPKQSSIGNNPKDDILSHKYVRELHGSGRL